MDTLQKLIVITFGLTIITSVIGLSMFYIEKPYISKVDCSTNHTSSIFSDVNGDPVPACIVTASTDASPFMEGIINSSVIFGSIFIVLAGIAFYKNRQILPPNPPTP